MVNKLEMNYARLKYLKDRVNSKVASSGERDELMILLYENGSISEKQYSDYKSGSDIDDILEASLMIAGIILLGYLLSRLFK
jgi:hypothetical protein